MKEVLSKFPKMLHGGDYNPDQWLDYPEIFEEDIVLMKQAKVNCVSLAIFAWATLEPEEGIYNFGWLDHIINRLYQEGIYTILATPTGAMPNWLTNRYEEVLQMQSNLVRNLPGKRHNFCYTSPV
ncbi:MAG TPA: beta-galactosidase, partial [Lachnospiraceae bacterium]|nr:beta-galactosidase [Lachnospiraceae bacterium]